MKIQSNLIFELFTFIKLFTFRLVSSLATKKNPSNSCKVGQKPFSLQIKKNIFTGSIETVESCDGIKLSMEKEWGGAET